MFFPEDLRILVSQESSSDGNLIDAVECGLLHVLGIFSQMSCSDVLEGRYVRVLKPLKSTILRIKEAQIFGKLELLHD